MKAPGLILISFLLSLVCWSQEVVQDIVATSGGEFAGATLQMEWTIGEICTETYSNGSLTLSQGFHQGYGDALVELPTIVTTEPIIMDLTVAIVGGNVISGGGAAITERGVYWGTEPNPLVNGTQISLGTGTGIFSYELNVLYPATHYYIVAYATNSEGTSYGDELTFYTVLAPKVSTDIVTDISDVSAVVGGNVICNGGILNTYRGVYWGIYPEPQLSGSRLDIGDGIGEYSQMIQDLTPGITYFIKAFAENEAGTAFGDQVMFETLPSQGGIPATLFLSDLTINSTLDTCFSATETITVAGDGTLVEVMDGGYLQLIAGQSIILKNGFRVYSGGGFHAFIDTEGNYCLNSKSIIASSTEGELPEIDITELVDQMAFFTAYPNPTSGLFTIRLTDANEALVKVEIFSMLGELLIANEFHSGQEFEMDLSDRSKGIYIIRLLCGDKFGTEKMIRK
jgi:hypothetical protein